MLFFYAGGGLGNLLFEHHAAYAIARDTNRQLCTWAEYETADHRPCIGTYSKLFSHVKFVRRLPPPDFVEPVNDLRFTTVPDNVDCICGYFQSWKYFKKYQTELRDLLRSNESDTWRSQVERYTAIKGDAPRTVCLHVRLGDAIGNDIHHLTPEEYYQNAMKVFPGQRFLVFSDSPDIAKRMEFTGDVVFVDESDVVSTFFLMSLCDDFIIPNSTFSLMAFHMRENMKDARIHYTTKWHKNTYITDMDDMIGMPNAAPAEESREDN
jgi:hypothetical protein